MSRRIINTVVAGANALSQTARLRRQSSMHLAEGVVTASQTRGVSTKRQKSNQKKIPESVRQEHHDSKYAGLPRVIFKLSNDQPAVALVSRGNAAEAPALNDLESKIEETVKKISPTASVANIGVPNIAPLTLNFILDNMMRSGDDAAVLAAVHKYSTTKMLPPSGIYGKVLDAELKEESKDADLASVVFIGGLASCVTPSRIRSIYSALKRLVPDQKAVIYVPVGEEVVEQNDNVDVDKLARRYVYAALPYLKPDATNPESAVFFEQVIKPRFFEEKDGKLFLLPPEEVKRLVIISHSAGCREAVSHAKYFRKILSDMKLSEEDIMKYMNKIYRFGIASPPTPGSDSKLTPSTLSHSLNDFGNKKPQDFIEFVLANPDAYKNVILKYTPSGEDSETKLLLILPVGVVPEGGLQPDGTKLPSDQLGHSPATYIAAFLKNPVLKEITKALQIFADNEISDDEAHAALKKTREGAAAYPRTNPELEAGLKSFAKVARQRTRKIIIAAAEKEESNEEDKPSFGGVVVEDDKAERYIQELKKTITPPPPKQTNHNSGSSRC